MERAIGVMPVGVERDAWMMMTVDNRERWMDVFGGVRGMCSTASESRTSSWLAPECASRSEMAVYVCLSAN
jgi:hypothetical protein